MIPGNPGNLLMADYIFGGWNTRANGSGTPYTQNQTLTMGNAEVHLHAAWAYSVIYVISDATVIESFRVDPPGALVHTGSIDPATVH